jgi:hypothetical protein
MHSFNPDQSHLYYYFKKFQILTFFCLLEYSKTWALKNKKIEKNLFGLILHYISFNLSIIMQYLVDLSYLKHLNL